MAFDIKAAAIEIRNLLSEQAPALVGLPLPRIQAIVPVALEEYSRVAFADARKRQYFKQKITLTFTAGVCDLTPLVDGTTNRLYLPDIPKTPIYDADGKAFTWVGSREQLNYGRVGALDAHAVHLDGDVLYTRNYEDESNTSLAGSAYITVPVYPATVTAIPTTLQKDFIRFAANMVRTEMGVNA